MVLGTIHSLYELSTLHYPGRRCATIERVYQGSYGSKKLRQGNGFRDALFSS